jgi:hypothetical protein
MDSKERSSPRHWRVEDILGHINDNVDKNNAEELLHCIITSTDIFTWNLQGEIVYKGQNIRGTNIVDLLQYITQICHSKAQFLFTIAICFKYL